MIRVLLIEDDDRIAKPAIHALSEAGFTVRHLSSAAEGSAAGLTGDSDLIVLDLGLPDADGLDVLAQWREREITTPVLVLTARGGWMERVDGLNAGADDYLPKPFQLEELVARMNALLRRAALPETASPRRAGIYVDVGRSMVTVDGTDIQLTRREFQVIRILAENRGKALSAAELVAHLHGSNVAVTENAIEVLIGRLRRKLGEDTIQTRRGFGYVLADG